jgi:hypothetical protein
VDSVRDSPFPVPPQGDTGRPVSTQSGPCDPTYDFDVNITNGVIRHPNLVKFHGTVASNGLARASVAVQDKVVAGSGRLSTTSGRGTWKGSSGSAACAGYWTAQRT